MTRYAITLVALTILLAGFDKMSLAATCNSESTDHRVAVLELYTSEGCNSCPPADRWLNGLQDRGFVLGIELDSCTPQVSAEIC